MRPDLTDDDNVMLVDLLRETVRGNRFLISPRIRRLEVWMSSTLRARDRSRSRR